MDSICSELIWEISVPCGIMIASFSFNTVEHFDSSNSRKESTIINSSINLNLRYNFSRFFSQIKIVLKPSSFAPFSTCNAQ